MGAFQKTILTAVLVLAVAALHAGADEEPEEEEQEEEQQQEDFEMTLDDLCDVLKSFADNCTPVPERIHLEEFLLNKEDAQPASKCLRYCLLSQFELVKLSLDDRGHLFYRIAEYFAWQLIIARLFPYQIDQDAVVMNTTKATEMMGMVFHGQDKQDSEDKEKKVNEVIAKCNVADPETPDKCESIHNISMCMLRELKARDLKIPEVKQ